MGRIGKTIFLLALVSAMILAMTFFTGLSTSGTRSVAAASEPVAVGNLNSRQPNAAHLALRNMRYSDPLNGFGLPAILSALDAQSLSVGRLRELNRNANLNDARMDALYSGDPLLFVHSVLMNLPCFSEPAMYRGRDVREFLQSITLDPKTGKPLPIHEDQVILTTKRIQGGPSRIYPPEGVRAEIAAIQNAFLADTIDEKKVDGLLEKKPDLQNEMRLWDALRAPLSDEERKAFVSVRDQVIAQCAGGGLSESFSKQYRASRDMLASGGVMSALIFNEQAGWTSGRTLGDLSERDYALVEQGMLEQRPDVIALLLAGAPKVTGIDYSGIPEDAIGMYLMTDYFVGTLVACELRAADCSHDGRMFKSTCLDLGGCDQPDFKTLLRAILFRDGIDPNILDREVARMLKAIHNGDLNALGIRRSTNTKK